MLTHPGSGLHSDDFLSYDDKENTPRTGDNIQRISIKDVHDESPSLHSSGKLVSKIPISGETKDTERNMKKNQQIVSNIFNPFMNTFNGSAFPDDDLDQVKFKIVEILSQKDTYSKENQSLKSHQTAYSELLRQNEELRERLGQVEGEVPDLICGDKRSPRVAGGDRSSPDGQEREDGAAQSSCQVSSSAWAQDHPLHRRIRRPTRKPSPGSRSCNSSTRRWQPWRKITVISWRKTSRKLTRL